MISVNKISYDYVVRDENDQVESVARAIDGVSCEIKQGDFVAVLGRNGSGKSTFAKMLNAILVPSEGDVFVLEMNTKDEDHTLDIRHNVGMVFQNPDNQIVSNVVEEDIAFGPENLGVPTDEIQRRLDEVCRRVGMTAFRLKSPNKLSGGQKQRVAIAGVLAMKPRCIVLDEPTAMLDPIGRKDVIRTITELNKEENITIVLITHYMEETVGADRVIVIDKGHVVMDGTPHEVFSQPEKVKACGLDVPQVTELAHKLRAAGWNIPATIITTEELVDAIKSR